MISVTEKPWGMEELLASIDKPTTTKIITVTKGARNSLHYHKQKDEIVYCVSGNGTLQIDSEILTLISGAHYRIERTVAHRIKAFSTGIGDLKILEISIGEYDENDIFRMEDDYDRK